MSRIIIAGALIIFSLAGLCLAENFPSAAWSTYGLVVNDTDGNTPQENPKIVSDSSGNSIIVWEDSRDGYADLYAQKISPSGQPLWNQDGAIVCVAKGNQNFADLIPDGQGGAIFVWQDYREESSDIYAQHLDAAGSPLWGKDGLAVCTALAGQFAPVIATDQAGGAIVSWHDYRNTKGEDIYAQRINPQGLALWAENGVAICAAPGTQWHPQIAADGFGGAVIVWGDGRSSPADNDIYGQRINSEGLGLWKKDGQAISTAANNQDRPKVIVNSNGAIVAWTDSRAGNLDVYAQKVSLTGQIVWPENGIAVSALLQNQDLAQLVTDGDNGAILLCNDFRGENGQIIAQRLDDKGQLRWTEAGRPLCGNPASQLNGQIVKLSGNEWFIVWEDGRKSQTDIYGQKINLDGLVLLNTNGVPLSIAKGKQQNPTIAVGPENTIILTWQDKRSGNADIYAQKYSSAGLALWGENDLIVANASGSVIQQNMDLTLTEAGEIIIVWEDGRSGFNNIFAQKIAPSGELSWGKNGIPVAPVAANQAEPKVVSDGRGGAIFIWQDFRNEKAVSLRSQHLSALGKSLWSTSLAVSQAGANQLNQKVVSDNAGGAIVVWEDERDTLSLKDLYGQRLSYQGALLWGNRGKVMISANGDQVDADIALDGTGNLLLVWTDSRRGDRNPNIYAGKIDQNGEPVWDKEGIVVCAAPDIQRTPKINSDGQGGGIVAWTDKGGGSYDIYAQKLNKNGQSAWMRDGIPVNQLSRTQQSPAFASTNLLIWEDYRLGNWDIFAAQISEKGKLSWGEEGKPVAEIPFTQYSPKVIPWTGNSLLAAWEDYRSGNSYEIYIQKLNADGTASWMDNGLRVKSRNGARSPRIIGQPQANTFYVFWEDFTNGGRAIYGQKYQL